MARFSVLLMIVLSTLPVSASRSQEADDGEPVACIGLPRIDRTEVIDDRNIAYFLKGGDIYLNRLPRSCARLDDVRRFSYRVSMNQICNTDTITVLDNAGPGLIQGATCRLGMFVPTDEEALEALGKHDRDPPPVTVEEIEVPR
jgi:hypothetical protein